jgi:hypothetical protein
MADSSIVKYIKDTLAKGYKEEEIRNALVKQGWYADEISEALEVAKASKPAPAQPAPAEKEKPAEKAAAKPAAKEDHPHEEAKSIAAKSPQDVKASVSASGHAKFMKLGFLLPIIGGAMILLNAALVFSGVGDLIGLAVPGISVSIIDTAGVPLSTLDTFLINVIIGGFMVASAYIIMTMPDKARITGVFIAALSFVSLMAGNGFIIGSVIAILGGVMAYLNK